MSLEIRNGFMEIVYSDEELVECTDEKCQRFISLDEICFVDVQEGGKIYCKLCGTCERYHRKKAAERDITT